MTTTTNLVGAAGKRHRWASLEEAQQARRWRRAADAAVRREALRPAKAGELHAYALQGVRCRVCGHSGAPVDIHGRCEDCGPDGSCRQALLELLLEQPPHSRLIRE